MPEPLNVDFSIIITNYNRASFIDRAIRSCLSQIIFRSNYEIIVVDDSSTDDSVDIISEFKNEVLLYENKENMGVAYSSNIGLKNSNGKYWMRVDADDFLNHHACQYMSMILDENKEMDYVYCDHYRVDVRGVKVSKVKLDNENALYEHGAGIMFRRSCLEDVGGYDEKLRNCEDYDLLIRLKQQGFKGYYLPVPLYRYYIHGDNMTLTEERKDYKKIVEKKHDI
tara:strand:- start:188 stop:862 length:675 start_codon:yes stop_codon:yes gene_type:complete